MSGGVNSSGPRRRRRHRGGPAAPPPATTARAHQRARELGNHRHHGAPSRTSRAPRAGPRSAVASARPTSRRGDGGAPGGSAGRRSAEGVQSSRAVSWARPDHGAGAERVGVVGVLASWEEPTRSEGSVCAAMAPPRVRWRAGGIGTRAAAPGGRAGRCAPASPALTAEACGRNSLRALSRRRAAPPTSPRRARRQPARWRTTRPPGRRGSRRCARTPPREGRSRRWATPRALASGSATSGRARRRWTRAGRAATG